MQDLLSTMNWTLVVPILVIGILLGIGLTMKKRVVSRRDILDIAESMHGTEQGVEIVASQARPVRLKIPFLTKEDEPETMSFKVAQSEVKLHQFLNPEEMQASYTVYKQRFALIGLMITLPVAVVAFLSGQPFGVLAIPIGVLIGWTSPMQMMNGRRKTMEKEVVDIIPDFLGYLSAFVTPEAELVRPIEIILENDEENADNILYASIRESLKELKVGGSFYESLQDQANILGVDDWKSVVFTLNQARQIADRSVVEIIREVEADFREERKLRMEMEAAKVTTKLSLIASTLLVPSIYTFTMAPAYMKLFSSQGFGMGG